MIIRSYTKSDVMNVNIPITELKKQIKDIVKIEITNEVYKKWTNDNTRKSKIIENLLNDLENRVIKMEKEVEDQNKYIKNIMFKVTLGKPTGRKQNILKTKLENDTNI